MPLDCRCDESGVHKMGITVGDGHVRGSPLAVTCEPGPLDVDKCELLHSGESMATSNMHPVHVHTCASLMCMACAWHVHRRVDDDGGRHADGPHRARARPLRTCPPHACMRMCIPHVYGMCTQVRARDRFGNATANVSGGLQFTVEMRRQQITS